ncbi:replication factor c subunit 1 [Acrodontium crateriforme]|uniref:Replication factor c subunit 1 n=1 Tax=Acrodontium crateriforme TaxID=150365 RepID=A0AAQ3MC07_9PEZI|nr:replication factor c subunit 1 [Acrodontium crateriforme]
MDKVYIVIYKNKRGAAAISQVHTTRASANAASDTLDTVEVKEFTIANQAAPTTKAQAVKSKAKPTKKVAKAESEDEGEDEEMADEDDDNDDDEEPAPTKKTVAKKTAAKKAAPKKTENERSVVPKGDYKPDALAGISCLFTGTFEKDRKTCEALAKTHGAKIISNIEKCDYVFLGTKAGQKKLDAIAANDIDTADENGFFALLVNGVPQSKLDEIAAHEPATKKQKK